MPEKNDKYPEGLTSFMRPNCAAILQMQENVEKMKKRIKTGVENSGMRYGYDYRPEDDTYPDEG